MSEHATTPTGSPEGPQLRDEIAEAIAEADGRSVDLKPLADLTYHEMADTALCVVQPELDRLTAEVERLSAIAKTAEYVQGPESCFEQECEDFCDEEGNPLDPMPERCSHMSMRYATSDDADAALWQPEVIRTLEKERDALQERLERLQARYTAARAALDGYRRAESEAAADELSSQGGDYAFPDEGVCGECRCALPIHKTWCNSIDGPQDAAVAARSEATPEKDLQKLEQVVDQLDLESRPSGSRAAEPQPVETVVEPRVWHEGDPEPRRDLVLEDETHDRVAYLKYGWGWIRISGSDTTEYVQGVPWSQFNWFDVPGRALFEVPASSLPTQEDR